MHHIFTPSRESEKTPLDGHRRHHPALKIIIRCGPHLYAVDNIIELHERLAHGDENPLTAFSIRGKLGVYDWHRRAAHRSMGTMVDIANGAVTGMVLKTYLKTCPGWTATRPALLQKRNALRSRQVARARRRRWSSSTAIWSR